jgi:hypothetical protein
MGFKHRDKYGGEPNIWMALLLVTIVIVALTVAVVSELTHTA